MDSVQTDEEPSPQRTMRNLRVGPYTDGSDLQSIAGTLQENTYLLEQRSEMKGTLAADERPLLENHS